MREIEAALSALRNAWIVGRPAIESAPAAWRAVTGDDELALLALAGHASDVMTLRAPGEALVDRPLLPPLAAPVLPANLRVRCRRILATPKNQTSLKRELIAFLTRRGVGVHPGDWLPDPKDDWVPDLYAQWLDWVRADMRSGSTGEDITQENYDQYSGSERRGALAALRARDPATARDILAAKAAGEPAEQRVRLIALLAYGLSEADADYLETLKQDRSDRVKAMARAFLARLGRGGDAGMAELAKELAAMAELQRTGLINRRTRLRLAPLKTNPQTLRRRELMRLVSLSAFASALETTPVQMLEAPPEGGEADLAAFAIMVAETGTDADVRALIDVTLRPGDSDLSMLLPLTARLTGEEREALLPALTRLDNSGFDTTLSVAAERLGTMTLSALSASPSFASLRASLAAAAQGDENARGHALWKLEQTLPRIGLLLDRAGATALLAEVTQKGLSPADPMLDMLHINAALQQEITP